MKGVNLLFFFFFFFFSHFFFHRDDSFHYGLSTGGSTSWIHARTSESTAEAA
jgi:hypothetical protein